MGRPWYVEAGCPMDEQQTALAQSVIDRLGVRIAVEPVALRDSPNGDGRRMYQYRATVSRAAAPDRRFSFDLWAIQEVDQDLENPTSTMLSSASRRTAEHPTGCYLIRWRI